MAYVPVRSCQSSSKSRCQRVMFAPGKSQRQPCDVCEQLLAPKNSLHNQVRSGFLPVWSNAVALASLFAGSKWSSLCSRGRLYIPYASKRRRLEPHKRPHPCQDDVFNRVLRAKWWRVEGCAMAEQGHVQMPARVPDTQVRSRMKHAGSDAGTSLGAQAYMGARVALPVLEASRRPCSP
jgi:hypothetical protein